MRIKRNFAYFSDYVVEGVDEKVLIKDLTQQVRNIIGSFAVPKKIIILDDLPKTRSGKVSASIYISEPSSSSFLIA